MTAAGHVLQPGEIIEHDGLRFHIERVERRRLQQVRLEMLGTQTAADSVSGAVNIAN